jgi:hypothetical protein
MVHIAFDMSFFSQLLFKTLNGGKEALYNLLKKGFFRRVAK